MWKDKVVLITGSSSGIGYQLAHDIGKLNAEVILNGRNIQNLQIKTNTLKLLGIRASCFHGDISDYDECRSIIDHVIDRFHKIDMVINCAGISADAISLEELNPAVFQKVVNVNLMGSVYMSQLTLPYVKESNGSILFISSLAGIHGLGNYSAYCCSKMALTALAESLQQELWSNNVHIGIAYVGFTENEKEKKIYNNAGELISQPLRKNVKQEPRNKVSHKIIRMIEKRKSGMVFTKIGKLLSYLNRISPSLVNRVMKRLSEKSV